MENKFNNLIKIMKNEKMTEEEKASVYFKVETFVNNNPVKNPLSPYLKVSPYFSKFSFATLGKTVGVALLLVIIGFGGIALASASALPGNLTYPLKIALENFEAQLASTPVKKIAVKSKIIETRFKEAEELIKTNKRTDEKQAMIDSSIAENKKEIEDNLEIISKENPEVATLAKANLETLIQTSEKELGILITEKSDDLNFIENEILSNKATFEEKFKVDLELMEKIETLDNIDNLDPEIENKLLIQDTEVISDITPAVIPDLSASVISAVPEEINNTSSNSEENNQTNP